MECRLLDYKGMTKFSN